MSTKNWFSHSCYRWVLLLVCVVLSISVLSSCIANNHSSTPSAKPAPAPAVELLPLESELIPEPETTPEPEPASNPVIGPTNEPESIPEPEPTPDPVNEPTTEPESMPGPEPTPDPVTEPATEPELIAEPDPEPEPEPLLNIGVYESFGFTLEKSRLRYGKRVFSHLSISKILTPGEAVKGFVEFNDPQMETHDTDYGYDWELEVLDPDGEEIYSLSGNYGSKNSRKFFFKALDYGEYIVRVGHYSAYEKLLFLKISPTGWRVENVDGDDVSDWD